MESRFWDVYRDVRSLIQKPDDALYILHTPIGAIAVRKFLQGLDESGRERTAGFTEQQLSTFAFEIRLKSADKNGQIRFNPNVAESLS